MISLCENDRCTGCWSCRNACPKDAISMDAKLPFGELHPVINKDKCVGCHLCEKACPILYPVSFHEPQYALASWAKDKDVYVRSSSGGIASAFTKYFLSNGGIVYGCASENTNIKHIRISKVNEYSLLQGSKYVQSSIHDIYRKVQEDLNKDISVLFIGTPCQVAGLRQFLKKDHENLLAIDLICHGVPSEKLFQLHIRQTVGKQPISTIRFRNEEGFCLNILQGDESLYRNYVWRDRYADPYYTAFLKSYTFRESCYSCPYAQKDRVSDITIGDFWGLDKDVLKKYDLNKGVSVMLPSTEKGRSWLEKVSPDINCIMRPIGEAISGNSQLRHPSKKSVTCRLFRYLMKRNLSLRSSLLISDSLVIPFYKLRRFLNK